MAVTMGTRSLISSLIFVLSLLLLAVIAVTVSAQPADEVVDRTPKCDACRTAIEQFFKGWEKTIATLAADGTFETQPGGAPKIVYNQKIEDYLQGFCASSWMKGFAPYIGTECNKLFDAHKREIVGKFLHGEEQMLAAGRRTKHEKRIRDICGGAGSGGLSGFCANWSVRSPSLKNKQDKCALCKGVVADAQFILRRSSHSDLKPPALKKKKLEVFELYEKMCTEIFSRYDDEPEKRNEMCEEMWEENDEAIIANLIKHDFKGRDRHAERAICSSTFSYCSNDSKKDL